MHEDSLEMILIIQEGAMLLHIHRAKVGESTFVIGIESSTKPSLSLVPTEIFTGDSFDKQDIANKLIYTHLKLLVTSNQQF